jgi:hypothetical protein
MNVSQWLVGIRTVGSLPRRILTSAATKLHGILVCSEASFIGACKFLLDPCWLLAKQFVPPKSR